MYEEIILSLDGYNKLQKELENLKRFDRPAIIEAIAQARSHGDLSENAEFSSAREKQGFIEGRIRDLESKLSRAKVVDISKLSGDTVQFGALVELEDSNAKRKVVYRLLGSDEGSLEEGVLSVSSVVGRALLGKSEGAIIEITTPAGVNKCYKVLSIKF